MTAPTAAVTKQDDWVPGAPPPAPLWFDVWRGIAAENPVLVQMLGMCPTMAVTNTLANGTAMGLATLFVLVGSGLFVSLFPDVMPSSLDPAYSLTTTNASSTHYTLKIMTWVAVIFTPIVVAYQSWSYIVFRRRIGVHNIPPAPAAPDPEPATTTR